VSNAESLAMTSRLFFIDGYTFDIGDPELVRKLEMWNAKEREQNAAVYQQLMIKATDTGTPCASSQLMRALLKMSVMKARWLDRGRATFEGLMRGWKECAVEICTAIFGDPQPMPDWIVSCILHLAGSDSYFECLFSIAFAWPQFQLPLGYSVRTNAGLSAFAYAVCTGRTTKQDSWPPDKLYEVLCDQRLQDYPQLRLFRSVGEQASDGRFMPAMLYMCAPGANVEKYLQNFYTRRNLWLASRDLQMQVDGLWCTRTIAADNRLMHLTSFVEPLYCLGDFVYSAAVDLWLVLHDLGLPAYVVDQILHDTQHSLLAFITNPARRIRCFQGVVDSANAIRRKHAALAAEQSEQAIQLSKRARIKE